MLIIWKGDYDGEDIREDLKKLDGIHSKIQKQIGGKIDGPYFPQDASVMYIFQVDNYEWLNKAGRIWFAEVEKERLQFVPKSYEVAVKAAEFFGE